MAAPKPGTAPIAVDQIPGKRAYRTCGWSAKLSRCGGAHNRLDTDCRPIIQEGDTPGKKWVCRCHRSASMPWCDGTHESLPSADPSP